MHGFQASVDAAAGLHGLRARLAAWLAGSGVPDALRADVVLATHEAVANALEHGGPRVPVLVRACRSADEVLVEVSDRGRWKEPAAERPDERGRGLDLIRLLVTGAELVAGAEGTTVRLRERLPVPCPRS